LWNQYRNVIILSKHSSHSVTAAAKAVIPQSLWQAGKVVLLSIPLRVKILGLALGLIALLGGVTIYRTQQEVNRNTAFFTREESKNITLELSYQARDYLLINDLFGLTLLLNGEKDFHVVGQADNANAALSLAGSLQPDIILLDITLGNISGLDILPELLEVAPEAKVVILTMHNDCRYLQQAMAKGAMAFVVKKAIDEDLLYAIRTVLRGDIYIHPALVSDFMTTSQDEKQCSHDELLWQSLSQREQQVMQAVVQGFTSREIANDLLLSEKTIATYRSRAMTKLGLNTRAELMQLVNRLKIV